MHKMHDFSFGMLQVHWDVFHEKKEWLTLNLVFTIPSYLELCNTITICSFCQQRSNIVLTQGLS